MEQSILAKQCNHHFDKSAKFDNICKTVCQKITNCAQMRIPVRGKAKNLIKMKIILSQKTLQIGTDHIIKVSEMHVAPQIFSSTFNNIHPSASTCIHFRPAASTRIHFRSWPIIKKKNSPPAATFVHLRPPASSCVHLRPY